MSHHMEIQADKSDAIPRYDTGALLHMMRGRLPVAGIVSGFVLTLAWVGLLGWALVHTLD
jgi:hypothetical protein